MAGGGGGGVLIKSLETTKVFARDDPNASNLGAQCYCNILWISG